MRRVYRQGFDARVAFRRGAVAMRPSQPIAVTRAGEPSPPVGPAWRPRRRLVSFAIRVARAIFRRARPVLSPLASRFRHYLFVDQAARLDAMHHALDEGRLMTATWAAGEQGKLVARVVAEVQGSRRMILDRSASTNAAHAAAMHALADEIAHIREAIAPRGAVRDYALLDAALVPGATVVHVGGGAGPFVDYVFGRLGADAHVTALGDGTALDTVCAEGVLDVLSIDAPGRELAILQGARRALAPHGAGTLLVRFDRMALRSAGVATRGWLDALAEPGFTTGTSAGSLDEVESCDLLFVRSRR